MKRSLKKEKLFYADLRCCVNYNLDSTFLEERVLLLRTDVLEKKYINLEECKNVIDIFKAKTLNSVPHEPGEIFVDDTTVVSVYPLDIFGKVSVKTMNDLKRAHKR